MLDESKRPAEDVLAALPVFPLPNVVFMPGMILPLNVFEPRYLALVDHIRDRDSMHVGVPLLIPRRPGEEGPRIFEQVFGVGRLVFHKELDDGRRFIRLEGVCRAHVTGELRQEHAFRQCAVRVLPEGEPEDLQALEVLKAQVERLGGAFSQEDREMIDSILRIEDPRVLVYVLCALVPNIEPSIGGEAAGAHGTVRPDLVLQQRCLNSDRPDERVELLVRRSQIIMERLTDMGRLAMSVCN